MTEADDRKCLPAVVSEGAVGLCHLVSILTALNGSTEAVGGVEDLVSQALLHRVLTALTGEAHEPAESEGVGAAGANLNRNLVGCATDAAGTNLELRADVTQSLLQGANGIGAGLLTAGFEGTVNDALGGGLLPSRSTLFTSWVTRVEL